MERRGSALVVLGVVMAVATACGGSSATSSAPTSTTSQPSVAESEGVPSGLAPGVPALNGRSVAATYKDFPYSVGPYSKPVTATTYVRGGTDASKDAPPGTHFLLYWVRFANPQADREEPFPVDLGGELPLNFFDIAVPTSEGKAFGCDGLTLGAAAAPDHDRCGYLGFLTSATVGATEDHKIPPNGVVAVQLAFGPVPDSAPLQDVKFYVQGCESGTPGCTFQGYLEVPAV